MPPVGAVLSVGSISAWDASLSKDIELLSQMFQSGFDQRVETMGLTARVVRGILPCNVTHILDDDHLWLVGEVAHGAPYPRKYHIEGEALTDDRIERVATYELGYIDPFYAKLPRQLLSLQHDQEDSVRNTVTASVDAMIAREYQRATAQERRIRISPLFGDPPLESNDSMCFVIAPFSEDRTSVFREYIQPTVEKFGLACLRVDSVQTNRGIVENIWRSICEARFIIADLTGANANVFYELGVAHTVGKEVILIEERPADGPAPKRPFDTMGINAIIYPNTVLGGNVLREQLTARVKAIVGQSILPTEEGKNSPRAPYT